ncbi:hypothetical protein BFJ63_vAg16232 [Fusarium oxysporum f. sp. narcissi]|uniref:Uncharacterized protein n=1 Tax=Fusarium oxysporum f. sp. narcissi TaxID=451672 RepID=A0A4Q2V2Q9_FUSOX|nr:hypothetical protein BFJ63_vAg16232 [Fusarium oxysporum f. sp. narcissi]
MTDLATPKEAIVLRLSQLQKLENLGLYYNSAEPAIICIKCGFAINPTVPRLNEKASHYSIFVRANLDHP